MSLNPFKGTFKNIDWLSLNKPTTALITFGIAYGMVFDNTYGDRPHVFSAVQKVWYADKKELEKDSE
jgi:hypothetical protein